MARGFYFNTEKNTYYYNDIDGKVTVCDKASENEFVYDTKETKQVYCSEHEVEKYLKVSGFQQLTLVVTENCNYRCKYCSYSGEYENQRQHNNSMMTFDTAKKAIDYYLAEYEKKKNKNFTESALIGFYGGEPFLNFNLIKQCVEYVEENYKYKVVFFVTTNGSIFNEGIMKFLIEHNFYVSFSLNGYKEEHDRLRVFADGSGTYDVVMKSLNMLKNYDKEFFHENTNIIFCYDNATELLEVNDFFENYGDDLPKISRCLKIADTFTDWYEQFTPEQNEKYRKERNELYSDFEEKCKDNQKVTQLEKIMFATDLLDVVNRPINVALNEIKPTIMKYTGACIPGYKIAVTPSGEIHCCEKVNLARLIGTVDTGIDYKKIAKMIRDYNQVMVKECINCPVQRICPICFTACLDGEGNFTKQNLGHCENVLKTVRRKFEKTYGLLEAGLLEDDLLQIMGR